MASYSILPVISTSPACPFTKPSFTTTSLSKKPTHGLKKCKAGATGGGESGTDDGRIDRRNMLVGLTGAAAATGALTLADLALAYHYDDERCRGRPFDFMKQGSITCKDVQGKTVCTPELPTRERIVRFRCPSWREPMRVRRPAHLADRDYIAKYKKAISAMKALGKDDPHSFWYQAAIHDAFCSDNKYRYKVEDSGGQEASFNVHFSWLFAPWHRMYIYFFERIMRKYAEDDQFALPYWNWDAPAGMALPEMYKDTSSPLYDKNRNQEHLNCFVDLRLTPDSPAVSPNPCPMFDLNNKTAIEDNLCIMYDQMLNYCKAETFLGSKYCTGDNRSELPLSAGGALESMAHTAVHIWTGDQTKCTSRLDVGDEIPDTNCGLDMGYLGTAARDPVFYAHHANVDRLWHLWRTVLCNWDFDDWKWFDTTFLFYDENHQLVGVKIKDVLDPKTLRYRYEETSPLPWLDARPRPAISVTERAARRRAAGTGGLLSSFGLDDTTFPIILPKEGENVYVAVQRPAGAKEASADQEEVLVIDVKVDPKRSAKFDVLINVPRGLEAKVGPRSSEFAGSFANLPHGGGGEMKKMRLSVRLPLRERLTDIKCVDDDVVNVTIVPRSKEMVEVGGVRIELL